MPTSASSGNPKASGSDIVQTQMFISGDGVYRPASGTQTTPELVNTVTASGSATTLPSPNVNSISHITLTASCTLTFPVPVSGRSFTLVLKQGGSGSYTVTWPSTVKWAVAAAPTLTTTVGAVDYLSFICADNTTWAGFVAGLDVR